MENYKKLIESAFQYALSYFDEIEGFPPSDAEHLRELAKQIIYSDSSLLRKYNILMDFCKRMELKLPYEYQELTEEGIELYLMNSREHIGQQIAEYRIAKNLTVRQLADLSGVSYQNITKIENGKYNVSIDILEKLTKALNLTIEIIESD